MKDGDQNKLKGKKLYRRKSMWGEENLKPN